MFRLATVFAGALLILTALVIASPQRQGGPYAMDMGRAYWLPAAEDGVPTRRAEGAPNRPASRLPLFAPGPLQISNVFRAPAGAQAAGLTLLLPAVGGEATLFINGVRVGEARPASEAFLGMPEVRARIWTLPGGLLHEGLNRVDLLVAGAAGRGLVAPPQIGPAAPLEASFEATAGANRTLRVLIPRLALAAALLGVLAAALAGRSRPWIALAGAAAAIGARDALAGAPLASAPAWTPVPTSLGLLTACLVCLFMAMPRGLLANPGGQGARALLKGLALGLLAPTAVGGVVLATPFAWGFWTLSLEMLANAGVIALLIALSGGAIVAAVAGGRRRIRARLDLGRVIDRQQAEIEATALALEQETRRSTILEERQRLARDMHDGIGGQLASLLARVRTRRINLDQMEQALSGGLVELRLLVDSLDAVGNTLSEALASFRARIRGQADAARMKLVWTQTDDLDLAANDPRWLLNLYRLLQESVTNAVRHSGGDALTVRVESLGGRTVRIAVEDNGTGFDRAGVSPGRGLNNMAIRADQLGAKLTVERLSPERGTVVSVVFTVPARAPGPVGTALSREGK